MRDPDHAVPDTTAPLRDPWPGHVLFVCSSGGHLAQLHRLRPWWRHRRRTWVTFDTDDAVTLLDDEEVVWAWHPTTRDVPNLLRNLRLAIRTVRRLRPDLVVSNGAGVALPFFVVARAMRIPTAYVEVFDRLDTATLTGRLCRPFADRMFVQWPEQRDLYPDTTNIGPLL